MAGGVKLLLNSVAGFTVTFTKNALAAVQAPDIEGVTMYCMVAGTKLVLKSCCETLLTKVY